MGSFVSFFLDTCLSVRFHLHIPFRRACGRYLILLIYLIIHSIFPILCTIYDPAIGLRLPKLDHSKKKNQDWCSWRSFEQYRCGNISAPHKISTNFLFFLVGFCFSYDSFQFIPRPKPINVPKFTYMLPILCALIDLVFFRDWTKE